MNLSASCRWFTHYNLITNNMQQNNMGQHTHTHTHVRQTRGKCDTFHLERTMSVHMSDELEHIRFVKIILFHTVWHMLCTFHICLSLSLQTFIDINMWCLHWVSHPQFIHISPIYTDAVGQCGIRSCLNLQVTVFIFWKKKLHSFFHKLKWNSQALNVIYDKLSNGNKVIIQHSVIKRNK